VTADWRTPGPDRPTDPRDELVQALLGLRWALPRTDADARVALDQLAAVAARVSQLAGDQPGEETPWDGQVQALLAQAGFALDWWRPVLDDVDLDWTLNHQAHLSADLARIASAGARILDQFAPAVPNPIAAPPSAVTEGPPQHHPHHAPRVAAVFGSVPAAAIVDPLANSGRHRRPAYEFDAFEALSSLEAQLNAPQVPVEPAPQEQQSPYAGAGQDAGRLADYPADPADQQFQQFQQLQELQQSHQAQQHLLPPQQQQLPPAAPEDFAPQPLDPELERLFRPEPAVEAPAPPPVRGAAPSPSAVPNLFGPPSLYNPAGAAPLPPPRGERLPGNPPPPAFTRPVVWGGGNDDDDDYDPIVRTGGGRPHGGMVLQAVGILGAVAALCWWAVSSLHLGSSPGDHPASLSTNTTHAAPANSVAPKHSASSAPATKKSQPAPVTSVTTPPTGHAAPNAADVTALQVSLLGGSQTQREVAMVLAVNTSGTGQVTVTVDYYGMKDGAKTDERTASWTLSGKTAYQIGAQIPSGSYCGEVFTLKASSGDATATQTTNPGC
jgi:hypothetical protein